MSKLTPEQRYLFEQLHKKKENDKSVFMDEEYIGLFTQTIDKYSQTAHFVYELLQNADDANATDVYIILKPDSLIFKHNGTKHFNITEKGVKPQGDINAITGIGFSNKLNDPRNTQNKIGKFGLGFKSVLQYTDTPEIYDDIFKFKIEDMIVPCLLEYDHPERDEGQTLFVLPFKKNKESQCFKEIKERLEILNNPLLFLNNLKRIVWRIDYTEQTHGEELFYYKELTDSIQYDDGIVLQRCNLVEPKDTKHIFLFSREIPVESSFHKIYIGFFYDTEKEKLITKDQQFIYCFFPTKETIKTCFISHAPFLLTDNRENIRNYSINKDLVIFLAKLAAQAIVLLRDYGQSKGTLLIDENITQIIPEYHRDIWYRFNELFEQPIIDTFKEMLNKEPLLLSRNDNYLLPSQAYTTHNGVFELLDSEQFQTLRKGASVDFLKWDLAQNIISRQEKENKESNCCNFFENVRRYDIVDFGHDITAQFMDAMDFEWVIRFYNFLREHAASHINISNQSKSSEVVFRNAPIIKTQKNEWIAPFINKTIPNVYLPIDGSKDNSSEYNFVNDEYLKNKFAKKLFEQLELKTPDEYDYIRNVVLKKHQEERTKIDNDVLIDDFIVLLNYYKKVQGTNKEDEFLQIVRYNLLLRATNAVLHSPWELYFETSLLKQYFEGNDTVRFFDDKYYHRSIIEHFKYEFAKEFLIKIGVCTKPKISSIYFAESFYLSNEIKEYLPLHKRNYYNDVIIEDKELVGFEEACKKDIISKEVSLFLWNNVLNEIFGNMAKSEWVATIKAKTVRRSKYDYYQCEAKLIRDLKRYKWVYNGNGEKCFVQDVYIEDLAPEYDHSSKIIEFLGICKRTYSLKEKYEGVTDEEQEIFNRGSKFAQAAGDEVSDEEILQMIEERKRLKRAAKAHERQTNLNPQTETQTSLDIEQTQPIQTQESAEEKLNRKLEEKKNRFVGKPHSKTDDGDLILFDSDNHEQSSPQNNAPFFVEPKVPIDEQSSDLDDTARAEKNLKAKNSKAQEQVEASGEQVEFLELLNQTDKYTFKWFKILMLLMHAGNDKITERRVQIDFSRYELICSNKILHLSEPTMPVPAWVSDAEKYSITTLADGQTTKIDGLIVKTEDDSIDISIEVNEKMLADLKQAKKIRIIAVDNTNIIDSLETRFLQLEKEDDFDMNANLPANLSFIYGPPGTGKTTELVKQVHDLLEQEPDAKILVLTPTNKAADVVAIKMANDDVCKDSLARFGATESLYLIEEIGCVTNRDSTNMKDWCNIVVATAARYAYDYVQPDDTPICDYPWDYIFIDEASMVDILTITYVIYKGSGAKKIVISGDPKQIQPVTQNDMPAFNIYDMVNLHGFSEAIFDYDRFEVRGLTMQHRSIPVIGKLVSDFAYDGLVEYDPDRAPMKPLMLDGLQIRNINFVGFDVAELDDIKGLNAINNSAFNLYSVIFTYNMIDYTIKQIEKHYPEKEYTIGVVCAYRAQADAIKNMLENRPLDTRCCKVSCGTVHSFQGDECDIMFIVLNPPFVCTSGTHVNNENIINVAMSRARDYIFFILPNGQQKGFFMKNRIGKHVLFSDRAIMQCSDVEKVMFKGNDNFIYENTHVTCHMPVNVYCEDNALYEVRMSDDALDIKINQ